MPTPSIFVAPILYPTLGQRFDADGTTDAETIAETVRRIATDAGATDWEELGIMDAEEFGALDASDVCALSLGAALELGEAIAEHEYSDAFGAFLSFDASLRSDVRRALDAFRDAYVGDFFDLADYAEEFAESCGLSVPDWLSSYVDWAAFGRDAELSGDIATVNAPGGRIYVFRNEW